MTYSSKKYINRALYMDYIGLAIDPVLRWAQHSTPPQRSAGPASHGALAQLHVRSSASRQQDGNIHDVM